MMFDVTISDANGGECLSTVELFVGEALDWSQMVWVTSKVGGPPFVTSIVVPNAPGGTQNNVRTYIQATDTLNTAKAIASGTLNYTGPAVPFHITGSMIKDPAGPSNQIGALSILTKVGSNPGIFTTLITSNVFVPPGAIPMVTGPFSVAHTIPDTGGDNCLINIFWSVINNSAFGGPFEMEIVGTIIND